MALEFDTAVKRAATPEEREDREPDVTFVVHEIDEDDNVVNSVECHAFRPAEGQVLVLLADTIGRRAKPSDKVAGIIDFFVDVLDRESHEYIVDRLLDPEDDFGFENISEIAFGLVEEWGGRPTKRPSDFAPSRKKGGQRSTRTTSKSTSSRSRSTGSSTRSTASTSKAS
jgi:hypothetical protein